MCYITSMQQQALTQLYTQYQDIMAEMQLKMQLNWYVTMCVIQ